MQRSGQPESIRFEVRFEEKTYPGWYLLEDGELTASSTWGTKLTVAHALTAEALARILLREILDEAKSRGDIT
jgi:hypothetical protein